MGGFAGWRESVKGWVSERDAAVARRSCREQRSDRLMDRLELGFLESAYLVENDSLIGGEESVGADVAGTLQAAGGEVGIREGHGVAVTRTLWLVI